ncbi:hypothetical protein [Vibrio phage Va2]|nr:hypothetical protein [Vibrio phage Va2]
MLEHNKMEYLMNCSRLIGGLSIWELELEPVIDVEKEVKPFISLEDVDENVPAPTPEDNYFQFTETRERQFNEDLLKSAGENLDFSIGTISVEV